MKKILSFLAVAGIACSTLVGCVDDNQYVVARGFVLGDCDSTGDDNAYVGTITCDPGSGGVLHGMQLQIINYITGESPWSASGGGSGTTFEPEIINPGVIFIDTITLKCKSIDGDSSACDGIDPIESQMNLAISGNSGGACVGIPIDISEIAGWGGSSIVVDGYASYHDSSLIKGDTSHAAMSFTFASGAGDCSGLTGEEE